MVKAQGYKAPPRAPQDRGPLRTFGRVATISSGLFFTLFAILAPDTMTTWGDAFFWTAGAGIAGGILALGLRSRRGLLDLVTGLVAVSLLAGIWRGGRRLR